jgi:nucleotide-binding universal stress UspA family protein
MFNKIVWATDGSDAADDALPVTKILAAEGGKEVLVVHCEELTVAGKAAGPFPVYANEDELQAKIDGQVAELSRDGVSAHLKKVRARVGGAAHVIADAAREAQADVIVVGTRGHTAIGGLLLGSVTQRLLHIAHCPVVVVPSHEHSNND